jgi:hypothetical protein
VVRAELVFTKTARREPFLNLRPSQALAVDTVAVRLSPEAETVDLAVVAQATQDRPIVIHPAEQPQVAKDQMVVEDTERITII